MMAWLVTGVRGGESVIPVAPLAAHYFPSPIQGIGDYLYSPIQHRAGSLE